MIASPHAAAESAAEAFHARDADAVKFTRIAVEDRHAGGTQHLAHLRRLARLEIVIAEDRRHRNAQRGQFLRQHSRFLRQAVVGQVARNHDHVSRLGNGGEERLEGAL
jgi:hypothetical protein